LNFNYRKIIIAASKIILDLLYHQFAWGYDLVSHIVSLGLWKTWIFNVIPFIHGNRILEIGQGPGHLQIALSKLNLDVSGLDSSLCMSKLAHKNMSKSGFSSKLVQGESQFLPFPDESFDQIVSTFPSEYIIKDSTIKDLFRVLREEGTLIILPTAWITDVKWYFRLADCLFKITGQNPKIDDSWSLPFKDNGFLTQTCIIGLESSKLAIIIAKKPNAMRWKKI